MILGKEALMNSIPKAAEPLIREFADALTRPTDRRFVVLLLAAIMTTGRRTVTHRLRTEKTVLREVVDFCIERAY